MRTGIDLFNMVMRHESVHVRQVQEHNALNPYNIVAQGELRSGWSWAEKVRPILKTPRNIALGRYNHFDPGPDGKPGRPNVDDDRNGVVDDPSEFWNPATRTVFPGSGDTDLDPDGDGISGAGVSEPDPQPNNPDPNLVEIQASQVETNAQDGFRLVDWSAPGKQHGPDGGPLAQRRGEINRYDDWDRNWIAG